MLGARRLSLGFCAFCLVFASSQAQAAPASLSVQEARRRFDEGIEAYDAGRYEASRVAFAQAYALEPLAELLINLGHAELKTGHYVEGSRHIARALREAEIGLGERRAAERALENAERYVARVKVLVNADGASVVIDGEDVGTSPMIYAWYLEPGEHRVRASKEGFEHDEQVLGISRGQIKTVQLKLAHASGAKSSATSQEDPATQNDAPALHDSGGSRLTPLLIGGAVALVAITGGVVFTLDASSKRKDRDAQLATLQNGALSEPCALGTGQVAACGEVADLDKTARQSQVIGITAFAVGGAAVLGSLAYYFLLAPEEKTSSARLSVTPVLHPKLSGLRLTGNF